MAVICGPITDTISYVSKLICGHLVKVSDIKPIFPDIIEVQVDNQIIPGVGYVSVSLAPDFTKRATINLLSKNVGAGTATISFAIETIEIPPPPPPTETTHRLEFYVKPHSWYTPGGAADDIALKLSDVSGAIINGMSEAGLIGWQYVSTEIISDTPNNRVIIRVNLNELGAMGNAATGSIQSMAIGPWTIVAIALAVVIIGIGIIIGWALITVVQKILGETFTGKQVGELLNQILENTKKNCTTNFPNDPVGYANCVKSGGQSVTQAGGDFFKDPAITKSGEDAAAKIDACIQQYNARQITAAQLKDCSNIAIGDITPIITNQTKDKDSGMGALILLGAGLIGLYIVTKSGERVVTPVLIERERLKGG